MKLTDLLRTIVESDPGDWHRIGCWGSGAGPSYRYAFVEVEEAGKWRLQTEAHGMVAVYQPDVAITVAWGLDVHRDFKEPWANSFPDPNASSHHVDVFYNGSLVYRDMYVTVDGGRAKLPLPDRATLTVPTGYARFIWLIDQFESSQFDEYFQRAGLSRVEAAWPKR